MRYIIFAQCLCTIIAVGSPRELQPIQDALSKKDTTSLSKTDSSIPILVGPEPKIEFPSKEVDVSTPIIVGNNPKNSNLPPRIFPKKPENDLANPTVVSDIDGNTDLDHNKESKLNVTNEKIQGNTYTTLENITKPHLTEEDKEKGKKVNAEQEDMLHSKYKGGQDVDELRPVKEVDRKDKDNEYKKNPKSEVSISPTMDKQGPKSLNETTVKTRESMLESTSKMMAVSSSVLANTQPTQHGIIEPGKTVVSILLTALAMFCFGAIGLLVWRRIAMRRFGRDVLINEDDFDEVADMHTFDRAQIQIT